MAANNENALKAQQLEKITGMIEARPFFTTTPEMFEDITIDNQSEDSQIDVLTDHNEV